MGWDLRDTGMPAFLPSLLGGHWLPSLCLALNGYRRLPTGQPCLLESSRSREGQGLQAEGPARPAGCGSLTQRSASLSKPCALAIAQKASSNEKAGKGEGLEHSSYQQWWELPCPPTPVSSAGWDPAVHAAFRIMWLLPFSWMGFLVAGRIKR